APPRRGRAPRRDPARGPPPGGSPRPPPRPARGRRARSRPGRPRGRGRLPAARARPQGAGPPRERQHAKWNGGSLRGTSHSTGLPEQAHSQVPLLSRALFSLFPRPLKRPWGPRGPLSLGGPRGAPEARPGPVRSARRPPRGAPRRHGESAGAEPLPDMGKSLITTILSSARSSPIGGASLPWVDADDHAHAAE